MRLTLFGTGYVGLVTGTCLAEVGHDVLCIDIDEAKVAALRAGEVPIFEPGLAPMVQHNVADGRLRFSADAAEGIAHGEVVFIAVGTPPGEDGAADLGHVLAVARTIGRHLVAPAVIVNKSTVPVGTAARVRAAIAAELAARGVDVPFEVVSNPEFLKEGDAVKDCMRPDRIIIGTGSDAAAATLRRMYAPFNRNHDRIHRMDERSAELTKYAANAMLATKISFINEMANIAERVGADIEQVRVGIGSDPRIGFHFIYPGPGYGGSCFPKDVQALGRTAAEHGYRARILEAVEAVNDAQKEHVFALMQRHYGPEGLAGKRIALWGLAFKPNTDDMREAPSLRLVARLLEAGAEVVAHDPEAMDEARRRLGDGAGVHYAATPAAALAGADALVLMTEWKAYWSPDFGALATALRDRVVFDGRNVWFPDAVEDAGIAYYGIGRGRSVARPAS